MIKLGSTVKDEITGFTGVVTGYVTYITGCNQALVTPKVGKGGERQDPIWIDEQRLKVNSKVKIVTIDNSSARGFDVAPAKR